ncbi:cupin domain-containing protein [Geobacter pelophilus]|uniref:Cupin domain-containing protein n=1 Tax=Geoanaerobacter pelophilus TaxID=60036 RepID=A0AAW4L9L0_9BACT|nr:cupin domain-containing protein [Geoanaerobacter pelophilus]MBT0663866.1 cupin domain-containing protein [Geoanaerobacter pelophilus]
MSQGLENIFAHLPDASASEVFHTLCQQGEVRIERIISQGQTTTADEWYDQDWDEWVLLLSGGAELQLGDNASPTRMKPGDYLLIPSRTRHRVTWTDPQAQTVWLAVHWRSSSSNG